MSLPTHGITTARALPTRPNLEHLKNEAKGRLEALRAAQPGAKLADAQYQLAREYGFVSWRELKAQVDRLAVASMGADPVGDWIRAPADAKPRIALHIWRASGGGLVALADSPDGYRYDLPVDAIEADGGRLRLTMAHPSISIFYEAEWAAEAKEWRGVWRQNGLDRPMSFSRGSYLPQPTIEGLDGLWDGVIGSKTPARITFRVKTDAHGTLARCDSPDRSGYDLPATAISREGRNVEIRMQAAAFTGELAEDGQTIDAMFTRGEESAPITLRRRPPGAPPPAPPLPTVELPAGILGRYVGRYRYESVPTSVFTVGLEAGVLRFEHESMPPVALTPLSETEFFCPAIDSRVTFELGAGGEVTGLVFRQQGRDHRALRE